MPIENPRFCRSSIHTPGGFWIGKVFSVPRIVRSTARSIFLVVSGIRGSTPRGSANKIRVRHDGEISTKYVGPFFPSVVISRCQRIS